MATAQDVIAALRLMQQEQAAETATPSAAADSVADAASIASAEAAGAAAVEAALAAEDAPHEPFASQAQEARELYLEREITVLDEPPSALHFYRDFVARNRPVLIRNAIDHWPALARWPTHADNPDSSSSGSGGSYLRARVGSSVVTVDRVPVDHRFGRPQGFGDSVVPPGYFVTPSEERMRLGDFLDVLEGKKKTDGVLYAQHQNSSLTDEFAALVPDAPELTWASEAFGTAPDATNIWIGGEQSVSTLHHDPYENIYAVVQGRKLFLLYPPADFYFLDKREYPKCKWHYEPPSTSTQSGADASSAASASASAVSSSSSSSPSPVQPQEGGRFTLLPDPDGSRIAWFDLEPQGAEGCIELPERAADGSGGVDASLAAASAPVPAPPLAAHSSVPLPPPGPFPPYSSHSRISASLRRRHTTPLWVEVSAGEVLYLPALWFHRVAQESDLETHRTIAVNFWYDMAFDSRYTSFRFQEHIARERREHIAKQLAEKKEQQQKKKNAEETLKQQQQQAAATVATSKQTSASSDTVKPPADDLQQAPGPASEDPQPPVLLLALCGLPASGKSSLARALVSHAVPALEVEGVAPGTEVHHLSFDDVYTRLRDARRQHKQQKLDEQRGPAAVTVEHESGTPTAADRFDPQLWKLSWVVALQWAQAIVARVRSQASSASSSSVVPPPQLLLLDDNFALRSMRRRVFQLARRLRTAFLQLHVSCEVETSVRRNAQRNEVAKKAKESGADDEDDVARRAFPLSAADEADLSRLVAAAAALPDSGIASAVAAALPGADASEAEADVQSAQESAEYFAVEQDAVSEATIRRMAAAFQPPPTEAATAAAASTSSASIPAGQTWERAAVSFNTDRVTSLVAPVRRIAQALLGSPLDTPADPAVEAARRAAAQQKTEASFVHQLDLTTRQLLNERIARAKADEQAQAHASASTEPQQAAASSLVRQIQGWNEVRRLLLSNVKKAGSSEHTLRATSVSDAVAMELLVHRFQQCLALAEPSLARLRAAVASAPQVFVIDASNMPPAAKKAMRELFGADSHVFFSSNPLTMQLALLTMPAEEQQKRGVEKLTHALSTVGNVAIALLCTNKTVEEVSALLASFCASAVAPLQFARADFLCPRSYKLSAGELPSHRCPLSLEVHLRRKLGLPTKLVLGRVMLEHDVVVASKGDKLTPEQCKVLQIFGVKLARCRPRVMLGWKEGGTISSPMEARADADRKEEVAHAVSPSSDGEDDEHALELRAVAAEDDFVDDHDTFEAEEAEESTW